MRGISHILAQSFTEHRLEFARMPEHWAAVLTLAVLALLLYASLWFYRRETRIGVSSRMRWLMAALRAGLVLLLAILWIQPVLMTYIHRRIESYTLVYADASASMQLSDRYVDPTERAKVAEVLGGSADGPIRREDVLDCVLYRNESKFLRSLMAKNTVQIWRFGEQPSLAGTFRSPATSQPSPSSQAAPSPRTDLSRTLRQAVEELGEAPVAGIVVLSDGGLNTGDSADVIGRYARSRNIPVYAVGIGDPNPVTNVRVSEIVAPANAFVRDPFSITAQIATTALTSGSLQVELLETSPAGPKPIASRTVEIGSDGRVPSVVFRTQVDQARDVAYVVHVAPLSVESVTDDNSRQTSVHVTQSKMRVLLIASSPRWDYRLLTRLLERDASVDVSCWLQSADENAVRDGTTVITEFPRKPEQLMQYDVVVLFDPQPMDFDAQWGELAQTLVSGNGGGLLYVAGQKYTSRFMVDPNTRPIVEMLPVAVDPDAEILINQLGHFQTQAWSAVVPPEAVDHPVVSLGDGASDVAGVWQRLGGVYWHYPVRREKPLATVLLRHSNPRMRNAYGEHVLLATQLFGSGRTGYFGIDTSWRWQRYGEQYFNRFWVQLLRHLMEGKLLGGGRRGTILTDRDAYAVGEPIQLGVRLQDANHLPLDADGLSVTASSEDGGEILIPLEREPNRAGWYRGRFIPTRVGGVQFRMALPPATGASNETVTHGVQVSQPNLEILRPQMDREKLTNLANQSAGGRYCTLDEVDQIPDWIEDRNATLVVSGMPIVLWDRYRWLVMVMLVGLLTAEWILRKRARLL